MNSATPILKELNVNEALERWLTEILQKKDVVKVTEIHNALELLISYNNIPVDLSIRIISIYWRLSMEADFDLVVKENEEEPHGFEVPLAPELC
jgi:hypothetical protein